MLKKLFGRLGQRHDDPKDLHRPQRTKQEQNSPTTSRRAFRPGDSFEPVEGLSETVQKLHGQRRHRSALDEIFKVLDQDPDNEHALWLAMVVVGESRTQRLQAQEPLTPAYYNDRRLDPIFTVCSHCGKMWVSRNCLFAGTLGRMSAMNPVGVQCSNCGHTLCRDCMQTTWVHDVGFPSNTCPNCSEGKLGVPVYPTGRPPQQMARYRGRVVQVFVFREGPVPPDTESITELLEPLSPDALEDKAELIGVPVFPWPDDIETHAFMHFLFRSVSDQPLLGSLDSAEYANAVDRDGNRLFVAKIIEPTEPFLEDLRRLGSQNPNDAQVRYDFALALLREGYYFGFVTELQAAVQLDSTYGRKSIPTELIEQFQTAEARLEKAQSHLATNNYDEAAAALKELMTQTPNWVIPYNDLSYCLIRQGRLAQALEVLEKGFTLNDTFPALHCNVGLAHLIIGNYAEAIKNLKRALALQPDFSDAKTNLKDAEQGLKRVRKRKSEIADQDISSIQWPCYRSDVSRTACVSTGPYPPLKLYWQFETRAIIDSSPAVFKGRVYFGSANGRIYCVDAFSGIEYWHFQTNDRVISSPAVSEDCVFIGSEDSYLYCLNARTGDKLWQFKTGDEIKSSPAVHEGRVLIGSLDGSLYCLDIVGSELWRFDATGRLLSSPAIARDRVYLTVSNNLYCLDMNSGQKIWQQERGKDEGSILAVTPAVGPSGVHIAGAEYLNDGTSRGTVYCLDPDNGRINWLYRWPTDKAGFQSSPAVDGDTVFFGGLDGLFLALNQLGMLWFVQDFFQWWVLASPAVAGPFIYISVNDGGLYCIERKSGKAVWTTPIDAQSEGASSSPAIAYNRLYVGTSRNGLLCFGEER